ncbi:adenylate/guanylate cyclase domain-containing protein [Phreatobacter stygius]|uniref:Adenylate/guanylate cyclase domain-containing protein n=1 Tax=Phreatobacter stygius TaxID=1940610 RepID=A0A4D7BAK4_9HYPH|nr:adenylate/guanylate cyclase domain-containing protein [Phreatobacter stygius]QCI65117.1 adenylate/guanylate cyclase domain-containing protein [Phreatobacter stygius]
MTPDDELFAKPERRGITLPAWLERAISIGIVTADKEVARRQRLTNVATFAAMSNAGSHLVSNALHDFDGMMVIHLYNALMVILELFIHRLHRRGPNAGAVALLSLVIAGNCFVVAMLGRDSGLQVYFTLAGGILFLIGIENWRLWLPFMAATFMALIAALFLISPHGLIVPEDAEIRRSLAIQGMLNAILINAVMIFYALTALRRTQNEVEAALGRSDALLEILLPALIAERLKANPSKPIADRLDDAIILFADLVGFTTASHRLPPDVIVAYLDDLARAWDDNCADHGVQKIKSIGDSYMVAAGIGEAGSDGAVRMGRFALAMIETQKARAALAGHRLDLRVGIHRGVATAGVIGRTRMGYDLWGDAVNTASRMESTGLPGRIHVSRAFHDATCEAFRFEARGTVALKGIGEAETFFLLGEKPAP